MTSDMGDIQATIRLEGDLGIASAAEIKSLLLDALTAGHDLTISLDSLTGLDVTIMQLLCAAAQDARRLGIAFGFVGAAPQAVVAALADAGLTPFLPAISPE